MKEIRLAKQGEIARQKEIWQLCFGDPEQYLELFFQERYRAEDTMVLLLDNVLVARLTILPIKLGTPDKQVIKGAMLYGVATHPAYQRQGLARELLDYTKEYLRSRGLELSAVVPAGDRLFGFYQELGYREAFYLGEVSLTRKMIDGLRIPRDSAGILITASPVDYNLLRNLLLQDKLAITYGVEDIAYQQKLSQMSGADLYLLDCGAEKACLAVERMSATKLLVKELLGNSHACELALQKLAGLDDFKTVEELLARIPSWQNGPWEGVIRPFGMIAELNAAIPEILTAPHGYLGLAFD